MACKVVVELVDDIDGTVCGEVGERISFAVKGVEYDIDLKDEHAREFRKQVVTSSSMPPGCSCRRLHRSLFQRPRVLRRLRSSLPAWAQTCCSR
jgi:hypothetical protein